MADHAAIPTSTQERNPRSAVLRTIAAAVLALFPLLNAVLAIIIETLKPYEAYVPGWVFLALNGILVAVTVLIALVTRILAVPGVNVWLRRYAPWLAPEDQASITVS